MPDIGKRREITRTSRKIKGVGLGIITLLLMWGMGGNASAQENSKLYMPLLQSTSAGNAGFAFSNPTLSQKTITLTARTYGGAIITGEGITNPRTLSLSASNQQALLANEIFGTGINGRTGWVEVQTPDPSIRGFFMVFDSALTQMDGAEFQSRLAGRIVFPKVSTRPDAITNVAFVNASDMSAFATFSLYSNAGNLVSQRSLPLAANSGFSGPITQLLPSGLSPVEGYAVLEKGLAGSESFFGFESYRNLGDVAVLNAVADTDLLRTAYVAHLASQSGYRTRMVLVNYTSAMQTVTITAAGLETSQGPYSPATVSVVRTIPAFGRIEENADQMFNLSGNALITGYIKWETQGETNGLLGYIDFGTLDGILLSAVPAQGTPYSDLFFSHVAEGPGYYTGIALLNPNGSPSTVSIEMFNLQGQSTAASVITLLAGERRARLLTQLFTGFTGQFGGYVRVSATRPVFAFQLFGSPSLSFLANVSAQGLQLQSRASGTSVDSDSGGIVLSQNASASLIIPPLALPGDTVISLLDVTVSNTSTSQTIVASVQALPSGTQFRIPVRLTFGLAAQLSPGRKIDLLIYDEATSQFVDSGFDATVDEYGRTASAFVTHFSTYGIGIPTSELIAVSGLSPTSGPAIVTTVTITGSGFSTTASENRVTFAGAASPSVQAIVTGALPTQLTVTVPAGAITGNIVVQVGARTSTGMLFTIPVVKPVPVLDSLSPASIILGQTALELSLAGTGFHSSSEVRVNGISVPATVINSTLLLVSLPGSALNAGVHRVTVFSPQPGGGESVARDFVVGYPTPQVTGLAPGSAESGPNPVAITITGAGFLSSSTVLVNGQPEPATFINSTALQITLSSSTGGNRLISVANPTPGGGASNSATFVFTEPPVASVLLISQSATSAAVGTAVQFTVELRNLNNQLVPNVGAVFSASSGGGSIASNATSNAQGRIAATLTLGTAPGLNRIAIAAGGATLNVDVTALVGSAAKLTLSAAPVSFTAGSAGSVISARIEDQYGNLTASTSAVAFGVTSGAGNLSSSSVNALAGVANVTLTSTTAGAVTVQGSSVPLSLSPVGVNITVNPAAASTMTATAGGGQTGAAGQTLGTALKVQVRDAFNNVVPGRTVAFSAIAGGGSVNPGSAVTNSNGEAQTTATLGATIGTQTFRAASAGLIDVDFGASATPGAPASVSISANQTTIAAGGTVSLTVTVRDQSGNTVTSASNTITLSSNPSVSATLGSVTGPTNGVATSTFSATTAGTYTVTASSGTLTPATVNVTVNAGAAANLSMVSGNGQTSVRSSTLAAALVVRVTDAFGNAVNSGTTVTFSVSGGGGSVNPGTAQNPNSDGQASAMATLGSLAGANHFTAVSSPVLTGSPVTFDATATNTPPAALVQVSSHSAGTVNSQQTFTVQVNDSASSPVPSVTLNFAKTAGNGSVSGSSAVTGADGRASVTLTLGQTAGTNTYTATVSGLTPITLNITGNAGTATQLNIVSGNTQSGPLGTQLALPLVVEARDSFNNPVSGLGVTFAVTAGAGASVSPTGSQNTGSNGRSQATATLGASTVDHQFTATAGSLSAQFTATGTLIPANLLKVSGDNPVQKVAPGISLLTQFQVRVLNAGGVAVPGVTVNWVAASGGGSVSASSSLTDGNGDATIAATVGGSAGANTFTATVGGVTPATFNATAANLAASPTNVTVNIASGSTAIGAYQVTITFDKSLVNLSSVNVSGGNGAGFTGSPIVVNIDNAAGTVALNHLQVGNSPAGSFTVANLTFTPIRSGTSGLTTSSVTVTDLVAAEVSSGFLSLSATSLVIN